MSNGLTNMAPVPALPPSAVFFIDMFVGRGPNCFDLPLCVTNAQVDEANQNVESNEGDNTDQRIDTQQGH
jgi:hypothetical protein